MAQVDYTNKVAGASCDDIQYWYVVGVSSSDGGNGTEYSVPADDGGSARLVCDTWSSRGSKDGSNMTTPFMEYHRGATANRISYLPNAQLRHQTITGLPKGKYKIGMRVRVYCEQYSGLATPKGVTLYANGLESADIVKDKELTTYGTGVYTVGTYSIECEVGDDGKLDFGLNVSGAGATEVNWVAFKNVTLTYMGDGTLMAGDYYLRNKSTGQYLQAGGQWNTQAVMGLHGAVLTAQKVSDGIYTLGTDYYNGSDHWLRLKDGNDGSQCYLDGAQATWQIQPTADGTGFTIYSPASGGYLCPDGAYIFNGEDGINALSGSENAGAVWEFVSARTRIEELLAGTQTDATFFISNPRFDRSIQSSDWEGTSFGEGGVNGWSGNGNQVAEEWGGGIQTFDVYQTLRNLPNGRYQLSVQGYYRYNDVWDNTNTRAKETYAAGTDKKYVDLYAKSGVNEASQPLQSIASETELYGTGFDNLPMGMEEAGQYFVYGYYSDNKLTIDVQNNTLAIGLVKTQYDGCDWTCWDNFELTLLELGNNSDYTFPDEKPEIDIDFDTATPDNPLDCTPLLKNPEMNESKGWEGSLKRSSGSGNNIALYGGNGVANVTFTVYQTLTDMPNGLYRVSAKGFYRYGDVVMEEHNGYGGWNENAENDVWAVYTIPYATITRSIGQERQLAVLYANTVEQPLPSIFDAAKSSPEYPFDFETEHGYIPNTNAAAAAALAGDDYKTSFLVPVVDGVLTIGVTKTLGYKYDWTAFDGFQLEYLGKDALVYATDIQLSETSLTLSPGQTLQLQGTVLPANATDKKIWWSSSNTNLVRIDDYGNVTVRGEGTGTIYATAVGSDSRNVVKAIPFTVGPTGGDPTQLFINEIQVSNLDQYLDPSNNYGGWIEFYNPTNKAVNLNGFYLSDDSANPYKSQIRQSIYVPANGYQTVFFDHNSGESGNYSGNANFKLNMDGGTIALYSNGALLCQATYPAGVSRTSWARLEDGIDAWGLTAYPTPAASNSGSSEFVGEDAERVPMPKATQSGFYQMSDFRPEIEGEGTIYCTINGSVPTEANGILVSDLPALNGTTVLRMRAFQNGKLPSPVATYTYVQSQHSHSLPVLMITADPSQVYSDSLGIFVTGTAGVSGSGIDYPCNWNRDWDRSGNMQLLDKDGTSLFQQDVNIARFGGWSRSWFPYNFKVKAQKQYENDQYLEYPFFTDNKPYLKHKVLQVRNGGNDVFCRIKDAALHQIIIRSGFYLDCLDWQPVHCYINGLYCGLQNLREPSNKHYALADYGIDTDEMDAMEITGGISVKAGSSAAFNQWQNLSQNAEDDAVYKQICDLVDVQEFANYMAAELYLGGDDWPGNNCKGFKGDDGKFHIVFFDVDQALRFDRGSLDRITWSNAPLMVIFKNMLNNDTFRKLFVDAFCLFGGSVMEPERCHAIIDEMSNEMNPALALEGLSTSPTAEYMKRVISTSRQETMINSLINWGNSQLSGTRAYKVSLSTETPGARILVNGIEVPTGKFEGTLFAPAKLDVVAPEGYTFAGWYHDSNRVRRVADFDLAALTDDQAVSTTYAIRAVFNPVTTDEARIKELSLPIKVNEVSAGNTVFASDNWERGDWVELYNNTDQPLDAEGLYISDDLDQPMKWQVRKPSEAVNTIIPARGHLIVWADGEGTRDDQLGIHTTFKLANSDQQTVIAVSGDDFVDRNTAFFTDHPDMAAFIDGITYDAHRGDNSVGRFPDGGNTFYTMNRPTPERTNLHLIADEKAGTDQSFMDQLHTGFTLDLAEGWNWASHPLYTAFAPADLSTYAQRIVAQRQEATRQGVRMVGSLNYLPSATLFKVQMSQADTYKSTRQLCAADQPISLTPGWNWIGYPVDGAQTVANALAPYMAEEGDQLVGQDGFATYTSGQWTGSLTTLESGKGYMLRTTKAKTFSYNVPKTAIHLAKARRSAAKSGSDETRYGFDKHAHPNVMGIIGILQTDGTADGTPAGVPVLDGFPVEEYTLLAYSDGQCRGAAKWVNGQLYLTTYGDGGEQLQFFALREADGALLPVVEQYSFSPEVVGTAEAPVRFTIGEGEATSISDLASGTSPHTTVDGYYSLSGQLMGSRRSDLTPGIYILKYADGSFRKVYVK